jgi:hypothetical protein
LPFLNELFTGGVNIICCFLLTFLGAGVVSSSEPAESRNLALLVVAVVVASDCLEKSKDVVSGSTGVTRRGGYVLAMLGLRFSWVCMGGGAVLSIVFAVVVDSTGDIANPTGVVSDSTEVTRRG